MMAGLSTAAEADRARREPITYALVVIGSGPAGHAAAKAYRTSDGRGPILLVSADLHLPYNRPALSKDFLRGESAAADLALEDESFFVENEIEVLLGQRVVELRPRQKLLRLDDGESIEFVHCVLATGSQPAALPVDGGNHPELLFLRSRVDGELLRRRAEQSKSAVVIGSGFIGCEAAVSLATCGLAVTVISAETSPQAERLGDEVAGKIADWFDEAGVRFVGDASVQSFESGQKVTLQDGSAHTADLILIAAGIEQRAELAEQAGLDTSEGRIIVDPRMRTSAEGVFAAGDVTRAYNTAAGRRLSVEHWGDAERMGEIAGNCAAGVDDEWGQLPGFWSEIGGRVLKYAAWADGYDDIRFIEHGDGAFTAWYGRNGVIVGVLTHDADTDFEDGSSLVEAGEPFPP